MGDIAFLLIIFFLLASQFAKESHIKLQRPSAADLSELEKGPVWVSVDAAGKVWVDGEESSQAEVGGRVGALLEGRDDNNVLVKIDRHVLRSSYEPLLIELSVAGATISLVGDEAADR
jgi:biopolymer transport protein ExbD